MILLDVNILVYAYRREAPEHVEIREWLKAETSGSSPFGVSELALSGFLRIVTNSKIFDPPAPIDNALEFVKTLRERPACVSIRPGQRHWTIFEELCRRVKAKGNTVPDAYFAALAIESGSEWITTDRGFGRFPDLRWRHPLDGRAPTGR